MAAQLPMTDQMEPDASTLAAGGPVDFDLSKLQPGQQAVVRWRSRPIFIVSRPPAAVKALQGPKLLAKLSDAGSSASQQPPDADNWHRSIKPEKNCVLVGLCTHLGCIPMFYPTQAIFFLRLIGGGLLLSLPRLKVRSGGSPLQRRTGAVQSARPVSPRLSRR